MRPYWLLLVLLGCPGCALGTVTVTRQYSWGAQGGRLQVQRSWAGRPGTVAELVRSYWR